MDKEKESKNTLKKRSSKLWWRWFWGTIITLLVLYLASIYLASTNTDINRERGRKNYLQKMREPLIQALPGIEKYIINISELSKEKIKEKIDEEVKKAYAPVYSKGIDNFSDFHYSVKGEYIELFSAAADGLSKEKKDKFDKLVYEHLFQSVEFDAHLKEAYKKINTFAVDEMIKNRESLHQKVQSDLNINDEEADLLIQQMFQIGISDMKDRFHNKIGNSMRATGVGGGAVAGVIVSKQVGKMFMKKVGTKLAVKGGSKVAGSLAGAAAGGETGLLCGAAAVICSPVGAVIGGVVGWFATDAVVVTADKYYSAEDFKDKLKSIIQTQEAETKEQFYKIYTQMIDETTIDDKAKLEEFKHKQNGDNL